MVFFTPYFPYRPVFVPYLQDTVENVLRRRILLTKHFDEVRRSDRTFVLSLFRAKRCCVRTTLLDATREFEKCIDFEVLNQKQIGLLGVCRRETNPTIIMFYSFRLALQPLSCLGTRLSDSIISRINRCMLPTFHHIFVKKSVQNERISPYRLCEECIWVFKRPYFPYRTVLEYSPYYRIRQPWWKHTQIPQEFREQIGLVINPRQHTI